ncbi:hypothetical protein BMS3Bbin12_01205 [bacterium BMS3Bbin12]|nr:hypothetical protein BMS3Abin12_00935 [bacterium BMS3Abin12]GBE48034.1 hypothetical protein BMS3Bbin12_01205 [bacterium BMS3Bbin12]GBE51339.1 hypothetical protein BMS3Bbin13_02297 [bacterium BMS3Bbin13]HDJ85839.1 hypothetical protein [Chromatiales bacterium]
MTAGEPVAPAARPGGGIDTLLGACDIRGDAHGAPCRGDVIAIALQRPVWPGRGTRVVNGAEDRYSVAGPPDPPLVGPRVRRNGPGQVQEAKR